MDQGLELNSGNLPGTALFRRNPTIYGGVRDGLNLFSPFSACSSFAQTAFEKPSTKALASALTRWGVGPREYALLIVGEASDNLKLSSRNVERLEVNKASALRVYDILRADKIIIEASALQAIQEFYGSDSE